MLRGFMCQADSPALIGEFNGGLQQGLKSSDQQVLVRQNEAQIDRWRDECHLAGFGELSRPLNRETQRVREGNRSRSESRAVDVDFSQQQSIIQYGENSSARSLKYSFE